MIQYDDNFKIQNSLYFVVAGEKLRMCIFTSSQNSTKTD